MKLITAALMKKLVKNGQLTNKTGMVPVVKFFGGAACTWLITEIDADGDTMFGLCDLGFGTPELGTVSLRELKALRFPPFGLPVERDLYFKGVNTLGIYAAAARIKGRIES